MSARAPTPGVVGWARAPRRAGQPAAGREDGGGRRVAGLTPYRLFHNHATIEPLLGVFGWGTPPFDTLRLELPRRVIEEAVAHELPGLVFTYVWALDEPGDTAYVEELVAPVASAGGRVDFVELHADLDTRLAREGTPERLAAKPSKRDTAWARAHLLESHQRHALSTGPGQPFPLDHPHTVLETSGLSAEEAAEEVVRRLGLPRR